MDISTLAKLGGQSRLDSRNISHIQTTTTLTFPLVAHHMKIKLRGGRRLCVHKFDVTILKLLKNATDSRKLDAYESIFLFKNKKKRMMNSKLLVTYNHRFSSYYILIKVKSLIDYISFRAFAPPEVND
jgi:hypothetical protein